LEDNYRTYKALQLGNPGQPQQQQQEQEQSIEALGAALAAMDTNEAEGDDDSDEDEDMGEGTSGMAIDGVAGGAAGGGGSGRRSKGKVSAEFKELVMKVLTEGGFEQQRPAKMTQEDFLRLLAAFNAAGIHFS
jgi:18S rRNA (adenine1779-N6/adenine1780-N6)-dimethyltransferase